MFVNVKAMNEKKNDLITRAETLVNTAESNKRELTEAEAQELAEIRDDVRKIKETLEIVDELDEARDTKVAEPVESERACDEEKERELAEVRAFENYVRGSVVHQRIGELAPANNGKIIPTVIAKKIIAEVYDICPILERSEKYNVKGKLSIPYYDESETAITVAFASEFEDLASHTGNFTTIDLSYYLAGALVKISRTLINNVEFDIVGYIVKRMAYSIARFLEKNLLGFGGGSVAGLSGATNVTTTADAGEITGDELITLQGSVKDIYQEKAIWVMNPKTRDALRTLKDDVGRYLLNDDISAPFGKTLLGKPVYVSDNMPEITANTTAIYYGDMSGLATKFSEEMSIEVYRELYGAQHAIGVVGWVEFDAKVQDQQKIAVLKMHAS